MKKTFRIQKFPELIKVLSSAAAVLLCLSSCRLLDQQKITDVLDNWTEVVEVKDAVYQYDYQTDNDGITSIPSNKAVTIQYRIQNPVALELDGTASNLLSFRYAPTSDCMVTSESTYEDFSDFEKYYKSTYYPSYEDDDDSWKNDETWYSVALSDDSDIVTLSMSRQLLYRMELSDIPFTLNPLIVLTDKKSPDNPYFGLTRENPQQLRVNSPPPYVQGGCIMLDTEYETEESRGKYVLCFNLPDSLFRPSGVQRDVSDFNITGLTRVLNVESEPSVLGTRYEAGMPLELDAATASFTKYLPANSPEEVIYKNIYNNIDSGSGLWAAEFHPDHHPVYLIDDQAALYKKDLEYTVQLKDEKGLVSTVVIGTNSPQLTPVTMQLYGKIKKPGYSYVDITGLPGIEAVLKPSSGIFGDESTYVSDTDILYDMYKIDADNQLAFVESGEETGEISLYLTEGDYYIKAYARKDNYLDSQARVWMLRVGPWKEVDVDIICASVYGTILLLNPDLSSDVDMNPANIDSAVLKENTITLHKEDLYIYNHQEEVYYIYRDTSSSSFQERTRTITVYPKVWNFDKEEWMDDDYVKERITSTKFTLYMEEDTPIVLGDDVDPTSPDCPYGEDERYNDGDPYTVYLPDIVFADKYASAVTWRLYVEYQLGELPVSAEYRILID